ncbi:hypothetical protein ADIS_1158 [Lunatimonas lonarensis]|uniref:Uncharacterized protein n=1 Tax=Lunatimonas lonarensis TaxID=1232681 RepID=R7ZVW9_9BACT|nr:hypothetical protein ADIS_1158 [Lunatimonas lonarensis]
MYNGSFSQKSYKKTTTHEPKPFFCIGRGFGYNGSFLPKHRILKKIKYIHDKIEKTLTAFIDLTFGH